MLKLKTLKEVETAINDYFKECNKLNLPPTEAGLAIALGFTERKDLYNYKKNSRISEAIKRGLLRIENYAETLLLKSDNIAGAIFWYKRFNDLDIKELNKDIEELHDLNDFLKSISHPKNSS